MRIGILTLPLHTNYGGILQAYALQTALERMGHDVVVFQNDYMGIKRFPSWKMPIIWFKRLYRKCVTNRNIDIFLEQTRKREYPILSQNTGRFIQKHIHTYRVNQLYDLSIAEFDAIIVGSDQIWRPAYVEKMWNTDIQDAFLRFAKDLDIKRIAYAVSFGVDDWYFTPQETAECKQLVHLFETVSVRENSGVKLCMDNLNISAKQMLDPTMLLTREDYVGLLDLKKKKHDSEILFSYILDNSPEKNNLVMRIAEDNRMRIEQITINQDKSVSVEARIIPSVEEWLESFYNADMVATDSFHGCVFSIIFGKPFIAIGNVGRGLSRFTSLMNLFNLQNNLLLNSTDYSNARSYQLPNQLVERLSFLQEESLEYLSNSLNGLKD